MLSVGLEETLNDFGLEAARIKDYTGVWLPETDTQPKRKICAIGVHLSRWITMHGFAMNVNTEIGYFRNIIPCGIQESDKDITTLANELGTTIDINEVKAQVKLHFADLFGFEYQ